MMKATYRHGEFIADFAPECARLGKAQVMRVARAASAHKTRLARDKATVFFVPQPDCFFSGPTTRDVGLLDRYGLAGLFWAPYAAFLQGTCFRGWMRTCLIFKTRDVGREGALDSLGIFRLE